MSLYLSLSVPRKVKTMEIGKRSLNWRSRQSAVDEESASGKSGVQVVDQFTTVDADYDFVNVIGGNESAGSCNKINDDDFQLCDEFGNLEEDITNSALVPSANPKKNWYWNRPYDVLLRQGIARCRRGRQGAKRGDIIKFIRCRHPNMKCAATQKGVGRALKRMLKSGHIVRSAPGRYNTSMKGKSIKSRVGYRFDRRACSQYRKRAYARSKRPRRRRPRRRRRRRRCGTKRRRRRRRCAPKKRRRQCRRRPRRRRR